MIPGECETPSFLLDIDGTLLQAGSRYHNQSLLAAVRHVTGRIVDAQGIALAGRTDTDDPPLDEALESGLI